LSSSYGKDANFLLHGGTELRHSRYLAQGVLWLRPSAVVVGAGNSQRWLGLTLLYAVFAYAYLFAYTLLSTVWAFGSGLRERKCSSGQRLSEKD